MPAENKVIKKALQKGVSLGFMFLERSKFLSKKTIILEKRMKLQLHKLRGI